MCRCVKNIGLAIVFLLAGAPGAWGQIMSGTRQSPIGQPMGGGASGAFGGQGLGMGTGMGGMGSGLGTGMGGGYGGGYGGMGSGGVSRMTPIGSPPQFTPRSINRQPGTFVGADSLDSTSYMLGSLMATNAAAASAYNSMGYGGGMANRGAAGAYGAGSNASPVFLGLRMAGDLRVPPNPRLSSVLTEHVVKAMRLPAGAPVAVAVQGSTAVLQGTVATEHDRELAEALVRLEPGISHVVNELQIAPTGAARERPRPSSRLRPAAVVPSP